MATPGLLEPGSTDIVFGRAARRAFGPWRFLGMAILWELTFFALLRQAWVERHALEPLARAQETIAHWYGAPQRASIAVTADCSGADVMALCFGVLLAYPVSWRRRLTGMAGALAIILTLNTLRIVTLLLRPPLSRSSSFISSSGRSSSCSRSHCMCPGGCGQPTSMASHRDGVPRDSPPRRQACSCCTPPPLHGR